MQWASMPTQNVYRPVRWLVSWGARATPIEAIRHRLDCFMTEAIP